MPITRDKLGRFASNGSGSNSMAKGKRRILEMKEKLAGRGTVGRSGNEKMTLSQLKKRAATKNTNPSMTFSSKAAFNAAEKAASKGRVVEKSKTHTLLHGVDQVTRDSYGDGKSIKLNTIVVRDNKTGKGTWFTAKESKLAKAKFKEWSK